MDGFNAGKTSYGRHFKVRFKRKAPNASLPAIDPVIVTRSASIYIMFIPLFVFLAGVLVLSLRQAFPDFVKGSYIPGLLIFLLLFALMSVAFTFSLKKGAVLD